MSIKGFSVSGVTDRYDYNYLDNKPEIHSIPTGGTAGQVLAKRSGADYAVEWADQTGGGGDITVDDVLSNTSENPVQNKVITAALATKADQAGIQQVIEDEVDDWLSVQAPSIGTLSYAAKQALLACFRKVAWIDDQGQSYYNALESELFPDATLESITAVFTQGSAVIYDTVSLDTLKQYLVVTATFSDSTTATVTDYTLSGTLTAGTSTITVSYGGKTDTFNVTVSLGLDSIAYGNLTYRDIFVTNNECKIGDFEEDIVFDANFHTLSNGDQYKMLYAGTPTLDSTHYVSPTHSLKTFGTTACRAYYKRQSSSTVIPSGTNLLIAANVYCTRYVAGNIGAIYNAPINSSVDKQGASVKEITDGFVPRAKIITTTVNVSEFCLYIGNYNNANGDSYTDNVVLSIVPNTMTEEEAQTLYENYTSMVLGGAT